MYLYQLVVLIRHVHLWDHLVCDHHPAPCSPHPICSDPQGVLAHDGVGGCLGVLCPHLTGRGAQVSAVLVQQQVVDCTQVVEAVVRYRLEIERKRMRMCDNITLDPRLPFPQVSRRNLS